jgi:hypothetical protein
MFWAELHYPQPATCTLAHRDEIWGLSRLSYRYGTDADGPATGHTECSDHIIAVPKCCRSASNFALYGLSYFDGLSGAK